MPAIWFIWVAGIGVSLLAGCLSGLAASRCLSRHSCCHPGAEITGGQRMRSLGSQDDSKEAIPISLDRVAHSRSHRRKRAATPAPAAAPAAVAVDMPTPPAIEA